jgi:GNAT superfamily N-acetyltransferase
VRAESGRRRIWISGGTDLTTIHGTVLRIDVDFAPGNALSANGEYAIPADNPFTGAGPAALDEIWAHGFRNPCRISMDGNDVWVADVGESVIEEIDRVVAGGHQGWHLKAGSFAYLGAAAVSDDLSDLPPGGHSDPVGDYDHDQLNLSVSGGVVYRGAALPHLYGGIGRGLHEQVLTDARVRGFKQLVLWVLTQNLQARAFYAALGFEPDRTRRVTIGGHPVDETRYCLAVVSG